MRFRLVLDRLAFTENFQGAVKYALRAIFYVFMGKKINSKNIYCKVRKLEILNRG